MGSKTPVEVTVEATRLPAPAAATLEKKVLYDGRTASLSLHIVIVGCGLGGLAAAYALAKAGHKITMLEGASAIGEIGAGIQVAPNLSRILIRWGLAEKLKELCVVPGALCLRRWKDGEIVAWTPLGSQMESEHGSPYYHIHRADFHRLLYDLAAPLVDIRLDSLVSKVDPSAPSVTLSNGNTVKADLIIGADGVKSTVREVVVGRPDKPIATGDAAYRAIVKTEDMLKDPLLKPLVDTPEMTGWMGPGRHLMAYNIRAKKEFNLVMAHPDEGSIESWTAEGSAQKWQAECEGWDPRVKKLLDLVPSTMNWKLMDRQPLQTWIHPEGKVTLLGDACHPMLPYRAQGSAMAVEDAVVLGNLFSRLSNWGQVLPLLQAYESLRLPRTSETQRQSRLNQKIFHYPDGPEQEARDASMRAAAEDARRAAKTENGHVGSANQWADRQKSAEQFQYDADAVVDLWWRTGGKDISTNIGGVTQKM